MHRAAPAGKRGPFNIGVRGKGGETGEDRPLSGHSCPVVCRSFLFLTPSGSTGEEGRSNTCDVIRTGRTPYSRVLEPSRAAEPKRGKKHG